MTGFADVANATGCALRVLTKPLLLFEGRPSQVAMCLAFLRAKMPTIMGSTTVTLNVDLAVLDFVRRPLHVSERDTRSITLALHGQVAKPAEQSARPTYINLLATHMLDKYSLSVVTCTFAPKDIDYSILRMHFLPTDNADEAKLKKGLEKLEAMPADCGRLLSHAVVGTCLGVYEELDDEQVEQLVSMTCATERAGQRCPDQMCSSIHFRAHANHKCAAHAPHHPQMPSTPSTHTAHSARPTMLLQSHAAKDLLRPAADALPRCFLRAPPCEPGARPSGGHTGPGDQHRQPQELYDF